MKTFILMWNPAISSYSLDNYKNELENFDVAWLNWNIWQYEDASEGDRFFMCRCGETGNRGICMSGRFGSDPYQGEDWSGKGRKTYYADLEPDVMIDSEFLPILTQEKLMEAIPDFDWTGGHCGRMLKPVQAEKLEKLWKDFLTENGKKFEIHAFNHSNREDGL